MFCDVLVTQVQVGRSKGILLRLDASKQGNGAEEAETADGAVIRRLVEGTAVSGTGGTNVSTRPDRKHNTSKQHEPQCLED